MNKSQKRAFYAFLSLYLISSYIFLSTTAYYYYESQKQYLHVKIHFDLHEEANKINAEIFSQYNATKSIDINLISKKFNTKYVDRKGYIVGGDSKAPNEIYTKSSFDLNNACMLFTKSPVMDQNIKGFLLSDTVFMSQLDELQKKIFIIFSLIALIIAILGYILSRLFFKPINNYIDDLNNFIKDVNHELNTPITALMMSSKQLEKSYDQRLVKSVMISTKQLYDIYKSLIEINFEQKSISTNLCLKDVLSQSIEYFNEIATSKRIKFDIDLQAYEIHANKEKVQIVFNNLISNAIKYSYPNSSIGISLDSNGLFCIQDTGVGIEKEKQKEIFKRFFRATSHSGGFGIGLDVVKKICDEYKIRIFIESNKNEGTKVCLDFK